MYTILNHVIRERSGMTKDAYGVEVTPEMIRELLDEGQVMVEKDDGTTIHLDYNTTPRTKSDGWNE